MLLRLLIICVALVSPLPSVSADEAIDTASTWVDEHVPEMMREARMPGFSIAVLRDGETVFSQAFGARDLGAALPVTTDTLFGIGSITKSFVAIAILQLAEQGRLSIDDPVSAYLPFEIGLPNEPIRIRHFLTHTPGFPSLATSSVLIRRGLGEDTGVPMASADDFFRFVNGAVDEIEFEPNEHFFYNNAAWRMLGAIVQEVSGVPFHEYVTDNVIRPLGMERTTFDTARLFADPDHLTPYRQHEDGPEATKFPYPNPVDVPEFSFLSAAGGISSSVTEMTRYLQMLIEMGELGDVQLLDRRTMEEMQTIQFRTEDGYFGETGYGFGLRITSDFLGEKLVGHGGSISVSTAAMLVVPERDIGVVMMGNAGGMDYGIIAQSVLAILMGQDPGEALPVVGVRERMDRLVGHYATYRDVESLDVVKQRGQLYLKQGERLTPIVPEDTSYRGSTFYILNEGLRTPVEFRIGDDGEITMLLARYAYRKKP
jgi:CubicO group peptidase (beta-lactamase class C family)